MLFGWIKRKENEFILKPFKIKDGLINRPDRLELDLTPYLSKGAKQTSHISLTYKAHTYNWKVFTN
jgi:hypothetical protein